MFMRLALGMLALMLAAALPAAASEFNVIYQFTGKADGAFPESLVAGPGGSLYGTLASGRIFKLDPPAAGSTQWRESVIYLLPGYDPTTGAYVTLSDKLLVDAQGNVYASSSQTPNGTDNTIFKLAPPVQGQTSWTKTVLCDDFAFKGIGDGQRPVLQYRDHSGVLFGTLDIRQGGIFRLAPDTSRPSKWNISLITYFDRFHGNPNDSTLPNDLISTRSGSFYGVAFGYPSIFKLTKPAAGQTQWSRQTLFSFDVTTFGEYPTPIIADNVGNLFGSLWVTQVANTSLVYKLAPPRVGQTAWTSSTLHVFSNGLFPAGGLVEDPSGMLYGAVQVPGNVTATLFKLTPVNVAGAPWNFTTLHEFAGPGDGTGLKGLIRTTLPDGRFAVFGAASTGGLNKTNCIGGNNTGCGTIYQYIP